MIGVSRKEITELNKINLKEYLLDTDKDNFRERNNETIIYKKNNSLVIWKDHSYDFGTTKHPYKDVIGTLREIYDYSFMETIELLRDYKIQQDIIYERYNEQTQQNNETDKIQIPHYNLFG